MNRSVLTSTFTTALAIGMIAGPLAIGCNLGDDDEKAGDKKADGPKSTPDSNHKKNGKAEAGDKTDQASEGKADESTGDAVVGDSGSNTIYVINIAEEEVCWLYLSYNGDWSDDVLGDNVLPIDYFYYLSGMPDGTIGMYAEGCEGAEWYNEADVSGGVEYSFILIGGGGGDDTGDTGDGGDTGDTGEGGLRAPRPGRTAFVPELDEDVSNALASEPETCR